MPKKSEKTNIDTAIPKSKEKKTTKTSKNDNKLEENSKEEIKMDIPEIIKIEEPVKEEKLFNIHSRRSSLVSQDLYRIDLDKYDKIDKEYISKYSNIDLLSILFLRFKNNGNPLMRPILDIYKTTVDPLRPLNMYKQNNKNRENNKNMENNNEARRKPSKYGKDAYLRDRSKYDKELRHHKKDDRNKVTDDIFDKFINE